MSSSIDDTASFGLWIGSDSGGTVRPFVQSRQVGANESVTMPSPPGSFRVVLYTSELEQRCTVAQLDGQPVRVESNRMSSLTFNVACVP